MGTDVISCQIGNTTTCLGLLDWHLWVLSLTMLLECSSLSKPESCGEKKLPEKSSIPWSNAFKQKNLCNCNTERILLRIQIRIIKRFYLISLMNAYGIYFLRMI